MKLSLDLQFDFPIWRLFYDSDIDKIPYEFTYNNVKYSGGVTIIQLGHYVDEKLFLYNGSYLNNLKCPNPIICAPNIKIFDLFKKYRGQYNIILANHNSFINENIYTIKNISKKYDLIINSSFTKLKRLFLSEKIKNKVYIGYKCGDLQEFNECLPKDGYIANFDNKQRNINNWKWIDKLETIDLYNQSKVGGIFSAAEGACFSSSEYLLCGLPVVSTECEGGREYWYTKNNSIICKPNKEDVYNSVMKCIKKLENNEFNPENIRNEHIEKMNIDRNSLTQEIINIAKKNNYKNPDYNLLYDSLKYYHSNNFLGNPGSDETQSNKELLALEVLNNI